MSYFTYIHIIILVVIFLIFCVFLVNIFKVKDIKLAIGYLFLNIFCMACLAIFGMLLADQSTKQAKVSNISYKRVFLNETIRIYGNIENIGSFGITACNIEIRLINAPTKFTKADPDIFKTKNFLDDLLDKLHRKERKRVSVIREDFKIGRNLNAGSKQSFSVSLPFPAHFVDPKVHYTLSCH